MGVAAAVVGGTALAGIAGSAISASAAGSAANTEASAANNAAAMDEAEAQQTAEELSPYTSAGSTATNSLLSSLGLGGSGTNLLKANGINSLTFQPTEASLESTPGYQFDLQQGLESTQNSFAAQGLGVSGAAMKGAADYATGLANNTLTTQQQIYEDNLNNVLSPLESLSSEGESAASTTGSLGTQNTANATQASIGAANASAAGTTAQANAISSGLNSAASVPSNYLLYSKLLAA
jgi:hypothetical protein